MMRSLKKFIAVACSAAVIASSGVTAFAEAPSSTAGAGNVLAYSLESVVVPSAIKVALNPQGLSVTTKGSGDTATKSTAQIVSFNYGIANLSTADKDVKVSFKVTGTPDATKTPITFVDTAAAATYGTTDGAAKDGELKMYLAIVGSTAAPTTSEATPAAFAVTAKDGANEHNATAANLADVTMTAASGGQAVFAKGSDYANAEVAFKLGKTTYAVTDGQVVDWDTTQAELAGKMEPTTLGDVTGFTITGAMNTGADWTKADVSTLTFTPVYEVTDVTGSEEEVTGGGHKQIAVAAASPTVTTRNLELVTATGNLRYIFDPAVEGTLTAVTVNDTARPGAITAGNILYNAESGYFIITAASVEAFGLTQGNTTVVATIGGEEYTFTY